MKYLSSVTGLDRCDVGWREVLRGPTKAISQHHAKDVVLWALCWAALHFAPTYIG